MKTLLPVFLALALLPAGTTAFAADKIDPKEIEFALVPEKNAILPGEPIFVTLTLRNKGKHDLGVSMGDEFYSGDSRDTDSYYDVTAVDGQGHPLQMLPTHGPSTSVFSPPVACKLAAGGEYTSPIFLPGRVTLDKPGDYIIT